MMPLDGSLPLALGTVIGNLARETKDFLGRSVTGDDPISSRWAPDRPGTGPAQGCRVSSWVLVVITGSALVVADELTGGTRVDGVAAASGAGNAASVPAIVSAANPAYLRVAAATVPVASSVVVTLVTAWWAGHFGYTTVDQPETVLNRPPVDKAA